MRSEESQTSGNTTILYYHSITHDRATEQEDALPLIEEIFPDPDLDSQDCDNTGFTQYRWKERIDAKNFGPIIKMQGKATYDICRAGEKETEESKYRRDHLTDAIKKLEQILSTEVTRKTVRFADKEHKFLVAIPDGLINSDKMVDIRCPLRCSKLSMEKVAVEDENFCLERCEDGRLKLREDHDYFYQVQGALNLSLRDFCFFVVWSPSEFHYQVIQRDPHCWQVMQCTNGGIGRD